MTNRGVTTGRPREAIAQLPHAPGIYRFRDAQGRCLYIGRAVDLRRRVGSYWGDLRGRGHLRAIVARVAAVEALHCDSEHEAAWLERCLLERRLPPGNRSRGGQEVPVYIRLDDDPVTPGLGVVHEESRADPGRYFGPYLGGTRVRAGAAALHRACSLHYAARFGPGASREMAGIRGVSAGDRVGLVAAVTAVLMRQAAAVAEVRSELVRRRDGASGSLAFELAARLQCEIAGLDWITADCKIPSVGVPSGSPAMDRAGDGAAHEVCGLAEGELLILEIRAGFVTDWRVRRCGERAAAAGIAATPARWVEFAARNAALAAALRGYR